MQNISAIASFTGAFQLSDNGDFLLFGDVAIRREPRLYADGGAANRVAVVSAVYIDTANPHWLATSVHSLPGSPSTSELPSSSCAMDPLPSASVSSDSSSIVSPAGIEFAGEIALQHSSQSSVPAGPAVTTAPESTLAPKQAFSLSPKRRLAPAPGADTRHAAAPAPAPIASGSTYRFGESLRQKASRPAPGSRAPLTPAPRPDGFASPAPVASGPTIQPYVPPHARTSSVAQDTSKLTPITTSGRGLSSGAAAVVASTPAPALSSSPSSPARRGAFGVSSSPAPAIVFDAPAAGSTLVRKVGAFGVTKDVAPMDYPLADAAMQRKRGTFASEAPDDVLRRWNMSVPGIEDPSDPGIPF